MATTVQTTQLDFDQIKSNLKTYFKQQSEFSDYDFEASGLSNILDVLAWNTHFNALFANFSLNEAYLDTAQLRSSVVSIAQMLGYNIRSKTAAKAVVNLSLNLTSASSFPTSVSLPSGTKFTTTIDDITYTFQTRENLTATNSGGIYTFKTSEMSSDINIYEGTPRIKTFIVSENDERQIFVIPDDTIDTNLITVKVYDSYNSSSYTAYTPFKDVVSITSESTNYRLTETPNGYYELSFGDGSQLGKRPTVGNKIVVEYLSTLGKDANGGSVFTPIDKITVDSTEYILNVTTVAKSAGGADKQTIESIRQNAPLGFAAQNRLVTAEDYETTILSKYSSVSDCVAWGGEDNVPADYGKVFVGLLFDEDISESNKTSIKNEISSSLNENLAILSIDIEFIDPEKTYLEITTTFSFNPNLTGVTLNTIESLISAKIQSYVDTNLKVFSGTFRKSNLLSDIDDISNAILSSEISVKVQRRFTPLLTASKTYDIYFPVAIMPPDDVNYSIQSDNFYYNSKICSIKNKLSSSKLQIIDKSNDVVIDNIGSFNSSMGYVQLVGFAPESILSGNDYIKLTATPQNDNVLKPLRNYYYDIDNSLSQVITNIDTQTPAVTL